MIEYYKYKNSNQIIEVLNDTNNKNVDYVYYRNSPGANLVYMTKDYLKSNYIKID
jgi:hypothetical protein